MAKTNPGIDDIVTIAVTCGDARFEAVGRESVVLPLYHEWFSSLTRFREMTARLTQSADALQQAITRATKE